MNLQGLITNGLRVAVLTAGTALSAQTTNVSVTTNHADVLPYLDGNTIATGYFDFDRDTVVTDTRLFVRDLDVVQPTFFGSIDPGFTTGTGLTLMPSTDLTFTAQTMPGGDGVARNLLYWNGEGTPDFGAPDAGDELFIRRSSSLNATLSGGSAAVPGFVIQTTNPSGELHNHLSFQARHPGGAAPADGYYLVAMQLAMAGLDEAEPTYLLFNADYSRGNNGEVLFNGSRPITDPVTQALAVDWVLTNLLAPALPGDADGDGDIDDTDLGLAISNFTGPVGTAGGKAAADGDSDGDGDVDDTDLGVAIAGFTGPIAPTAVPEPASAITLIASGILLKRRRRARE